MITPEVLLAEIDDLLRSVPALDSLHHGTDDILAWRVRVPIYTFTLKAENVQLSVASQLTEDMIKNAGKMVPSITGDTSITRPVSLLVSSLDKATDELQAFIAAWSALEIFVHASFKSTYEIEWFGITKSVASPAARPIFDRFKEVMSGKYRVTDKFLILASVLDEPGATADVETFRKLKEIRDNLLHGLETPQSLPTNQVQSIIAKYLNLHYMRANE